jgi:hypothetical protein
MNISPTEAEEALDAIQTMVHKTRQGISSSGAYNFLIVWGFVWLFGFSASHFAPNQIAGYVWMSLDILGGLLSAVIGFRMNQNIRSPSASATGKRIAWFWVLLFFYCTIAIGVTWPIGGKAIAMVIILFVMIGWIAMGLLLSFTSIWCGLAITALALIGYFLLPDIFYLWMAALGGGGMIIMGIFIKTRW